MTLRTMLLTTALMLAAAPSFACRTDIDCPAGYKCIENVILKGGRSCLKPEHVYSHPYRELVKGEGSRQPQVRRNNAATGLACQTDRDCRSNQTCTRPNSNSGWRCVAR